MTEKHAAVGVAARSRQSRKSRRSEMCTSEYRQMFMIGMFLTHFSYLTLFYDLFRQYV
jgi:hypothetical protein